MPRERTRKLLDSRARRRDGEHGRRTPVTEQWFDLECPHHSGNGVEVDVVVARRRLKGSAEERQDIFVRHQPTLLDPAPALEQHLELLDHVANGM
jgi:hypothetical protein